MARDPRDEGIGWPADRTECPSSIPGTLLEELRDDLVDVAALAAAARTAVEEIPRDYRRAAALIALASDAAEAALSRADAAVAAPEARPHTSHNGCASHGGR